MQGCKMENRDLEKLSDPMLANSLVKCCLESHSPGLIWFHQKTRPTSSAKSLFLLLPDLED